MSYFLKEMAMKKLNPDILTSIAAGKARRQERLHQVDDFEGLIRVDLTREDFIPIRRDRLRAEPIRFVPLDLDDMDAIRKTFERVIGW
jgi:hypothetical protein